MPSWSARGRSPTREVADATADLRRLALDRPELAGPAAALAPVIEVAFARPMGPPRPVDAEAAARAWAGGQPFLRAHPPEVVPSWLAAQVSAILHKLEPTNVDARPFRRAVRRDHDRLAGWGRRLIAGDADGVRLDARGRAIDPDLAVSVLRIGLLPELRRHADALGNPGDRWARGDCPCCGDRPALAELRGLEQALILRCGLCAAGWPGPRLGCPDCGSTDHRDRGLRHVDGEHDRRLALCAACGGRLKIVSTLGPLSPPGLLVADLASVHLDLLHADSRTSS